MVDCRPSASNRVGRNCKPWEAPPWSTLLGPGLDSLPILGFSEEVLDLNPCSPVWSIPRRTSLSPQGTLLYEKKKPNEMDSLHEDGSPLYENARRAVSDFCQWTGDVASLKIDEEFVMKQFHLDCQSKPSCYGLSMMTFDQLPLELKKSVGPNKWQEAELFKEREQKLENPSKPKYVKMRYGAWYLDPKLWKMQRADEPLVDPKVLRKAQDELLKKQQQEQEELLSFAKLYGPAAFKEFILRKGYRMPSFLEKINVRKDVNASVKRFL